MASQQITLNKLNEELEKLGGELKTVENACTSLVSCNE